MKITHLALCTVVAVSFASCSSKSKRSSDSKELSSASPDAQVRTTASYDVAQKEAFQLTEGWPQASRFAATEMIQKHGKPSLQTSDTLVWRNIAPFEEIIVYREVYSSNFPILHKNALAHVVSYKVPKDKIEDLRRFNGDLIIDARRGQLTAISEQEAMNILSLNLAHEVVNGRMTADEARIKYGKEALNFMNGEKTAMTQVLNFGEQYNTLDKGESITENIEWKDESKSEEIQAEEAVPAEESPEPMKEEVQSEEMTDPSADLEE